MMVLLSTECDVFVLFMQFVLLLYSFLCLSALQRDHIHELYQSLIILIVWMGSNVPLVCLAMLGWETSIRPLLTSVLPHAPLYDPDQEGRTSLDYLCWGKRRRGDKREMEEWLSDANAKKSLEGEREDFGVQHEIWDLAALGNLLFCNCT